MILKASRKGLSTILGARKCRESQSGDAASLLLRECPQLPDEAVTVLPRHANITYNDIGFRRAKKRFEGFGHTRCRRHVGLAMHQDGPDDFAGIALVLDDQQVKSFELWGTPGFETRWRLRDGARKRA